MGYLWNRLACCFFWLELDAQTMSDCLKHHLIHPHHGLHSCLFGFELETKPKGSPVASEVLCRWGFAALPWKCAFSGAALFLSDGEKPPAETIPIGQWIPVWFVLHWVAPGEQNQVSPFCRMLVPLSRCVWAYTLSQFIVMIYFYFL